MRRETARIAIYDVKPFFQVGETNTRVGAVLLDLRLENEILNIEIEPRVRDGHLADNGRLAVWAYTVLESVLDERDEEERRNSHVLDAVGEMELDVGLGPKPQFHEIHVTAEEIDLLGERDRLVTAVVEDETHHTAEAVDGLLGSIGGDAYKGVDVVEAIEEEVRADLVSEEIEFGGKSLILNLLAINFELLAIIEQADAERGTHGKH